MDLNLDILSGVSSNNLQKLSDLDHLIRGKENTYNYPIRKQDTLKLWKELGVRLHTGSNDIHHPDTVADAGSLERGVL